MKEIKKTLVAGFLACSALNAQAEMSPFGYGVKVGVTDSSLRVNEEAKFAGKNAKTKFLDNMFVGATLYGEYAFTDYIGVETGVGYMKQGGSVVGEEETTKDADGKDGKSTPSILISTQGLFVPLSVCVYPLGREEGEGILKAFLGGSLYFPLFNPTLKNGTTAIKKESLNTDQNKQLPGFDFGLKVGLGYEFPFGVSLEGRYGLNFKERFGKKDENACQTIFAEVTDLKSAKTSYITLGLGYNLASLFSE
jgi:hypothetical protein